MWYRFSAEIPANRLMNNPFIKEFRVPSGIIHEFRMRYAPGPRGMVSSAVFLGKTKMFPMDDSEWFEGDQEWVEGVCHVVNKKGWHWSIRGYSPDTNYEHVVYVDLQVDKEVHVSPGTVLEDLVAIMKKLIGI